MSNPAKPDLPVTLPVRLPLRFRAAMVVAAFVPATMEGCQELGRRDLLSRATAMTPGRVIELTREQHGTLRYQYEVEGHTYTHNGYEHLCGAKATAGIRLPVYYDPAKPNEAFLGRRSCYEVGWTHVVVALVFGVVAMRIGYWWLTSGGHLFLARHPRLKRLQTPAT